MTGWKTKKFSKWLISLLIGMMIFQTSMIGSFLKPGHAKAIDPGTSVYATASGGSVATLDKSNIEGAPDGNVATVPSDVANRYVWGKTYTHALSGTIAKVEIAATYKVDVNFTDDFLVLKYGIGSPNPDGLTSYAEIPDNTIFETQYLDVTGDRTWTFDDVTNLYVYAINEVVDTVDGNNLLIDSLFVRVTTEAGPTEFIVDAGPDVTANSEFTQDATVSGGKEPYTYAWTYTGPEGSELTLEGIDQEDVTVKNASMDGEYELTLTATDSSDPALEGSSSFTLIWDTTAPIVSINLDNSTYDESNFPQPITGDAEDINGITKVEVNIQDKTADPTLFWNGTEWVEESDTWNEATLDNSWSYQFDPVNMTYGHNYDVNARSYDSLNQVSDVVTKSFSYVDDVVPVITLLGDNPQTIEASTGYVELGATADDNYDGDITANIVIDTTNVDTNTVGSYAVTYDVTDSNGNVATQVTRTVNVVDNELPTGTITINGGAGVTANALVNLTFTYDDAYQMRYGEKEFSIDDPTAWQDLIDTADYTFDSEGMKTVYVQYKDQAGNVSVNYSASIYYKDTAQDITQEPVNDTTLSVDYKNIVIDKDDGTSPIATGDATITFSQYVRDPEGGHSGISAFGKYFDVSVDPEENMNWPVTVKVWFTQTDLDDAGINSIDKIVGLYYWDFSSSSWKLYDDTGVVIEDNGNYIGYVWANVDHFTPMMSGADITAPEKPANFRSEAQDGAVKLIWDKVDDAVKYSVRYRRATADDSKEGYDYIETTNTELTISNLENKVIYEFGVQAIDNFDNHSEWSQVNASPQKSEEAETVSTGVITPTTKARTWLGIGVAEAAPEEKKEEKKEETKIETVSPEEGGIAGEEAEETTQGGSKAIVTIAILIIAAGAGLGGYYGYQWWLGKEAVETPKTPKSGKGEKGGRW